MKAGGSELGWVGSELRCVISCEVKLMVAVSAPVQAICPDTGDAFSELLLGVCARERSLRSGCERGTQLSVYMVRRGIS